MDYFKKKKNFFISSSNTTAQPETKPLHLVALKFRVKLTQEIPSNSIRGDPGSSPRLPEQKYIIEGKHLLFRALQWGC